MKILLFVVFLFLGFISYGQADMILYNGRIFTSNKTDLWADAIAIKGDRILGIGKEKEVMKLKLSNTRMIDLENHLVVPGFNDAHIHIGGNTASREIIFSQDPLGPTPWEMVRDSLSKVIKEIPVNMLIQASINSDLFEDQRARRKLLDSIAPNHPVILYAWSGHGKILNSAALSWLGIDEQTNFAGGRLEKDEMGKLTGFLEEYAGYRVGSLMNEKLSADKIIEDIQTFYKYTASLGITTMQNMCTQLSPSLAEIIYSNQFIDCRTRVITFPITDKDGLILIKLDGYFKQLNANNYASGVKMILDGTPVERLACVIKPYKDRKNQYGRLNFNIKALKSFMQFALAHNQQILIHAVGDSAVATVVSAMRSLHPDDFWKDKRLRIEHGNMAIMKKEDLQTMKQLGIVIVQNPAHLALPSMTFQRFESSSLEYFESMRSLIDNQIPFAIGSDGPVNPFVNLMLTTIHPDNPKEAITLQEAVIAYTLGSAYAEFTEKDKGSLENGKLADLAVLSQNIFEIAPDLLPATGSILTILGGKIVFDKKLIK